MVEREIKSLSLNYSKIEHNFQNHVRIYKAGRKQSFPEQFPQNLRPFVLEKVLEVSAEMKNNFNID